MKSNSLHIFISFAAILTFFFQSDVLAQEPMNPSDIYAKAEQEADRLQELLDLEDGQVFYVDSTLKHDYPALMADYARLDASKVQNTGMYQMVYDKWMEQIDVTYKNIFTEKQWAAYLKSGAARTQKAREKRKAKGY